MHPNTDDINETMFGIGIRHVGKRTNIGGEIIWSSEKNYLEIGANIEVLLAKSIILAVSIGNESEDLIIENNQIRVKPSLKYNLSEPKN